MNSRTIWLNVLLDDLNYGNPARMLRPGLQSSPAAFDLMVRHQFECLHCTAWL